MGVWQDLSRICCSKSSKLLRHIFQPNCEQIQYSISRYLSLSSVTGSSPFVKKQTEYRSSHDYLCRQRNFSSINENQIDSRDENVLNTLNENMTVITNFISEDEEKLLLQE